MYASAREVSTVPRQMRAMAMGLWLPSGACSTPSSPGSDWSARPPQTRRAFASCTARTWSTCPTRTSPCNWGRRGRWTRRPWPRACWPTAAAATASSSTRCSRRCCARSALRHPPPGGRRRRGADEPHGAAGRVDGEPWIADAGLGEGFMEPLPLREGTFERGPFTYTLTREPEGTWWMGQHEWSSFSGFRMQAATSAVATSSRTTAGSPRARLAVRAHAGRAVAARRPDRDAALADAVRDRAFGRHEARAVAGRVPGRAAGRVRDRVGGARLERLWARAVEQHEAFMAGVANTGH